VKAFIKEHRSLFWYIKESEKEHISPILLVETILNYGDLDSIKQLFALLGINVVAEIFYHTTRQRTRINYFPQVVNFFNLYFEKYASGNPDP